MTLPVGMILLGTLLVWAGWTGKSVTGLLRDPESQGVQPPAGPRGPISGVAFA